MRRLAVLATVLGLALGTVIPAAADPRPHCQRVTLTENSGNGPTYHVRVCDALLPSGEGWRLTVDGGPLEDGAVIFGSRQP